MPQPPNIILVIDYDAQLRRFIGAGLEFHGYSVRTVESGAAGLSAAEHIRPDLIVLDPGLPDMSGTELLETLRSWSNVPIIVISIRADEEHKVHILKIGADDYVVKPFGIAELAARCEAALRRYDRAADNDPTVRTGPLQVDLVSRAVSIDGQHIALTRQEYRLMHILASHLALVVTHSELMKELWADSSANNIKYLRTLVRKVRQKIEVNPTQPKFIISASGTGYRLERHATIAATSKIER